MTRDEAAYKIAHSFYDSASDRWDFVKARAEKLVDAFSDLGMLKLESKSVSRASPEYKLYEALFEHIPTLEFAPFKELIDRANLKIVEKQ